MQNNDLKAVTKLLEQELLKQNVFFFFGFFQIFLKIKKPLKSHSTVVYIKYILVQCIKPAGNNQNNTLITEDRNVLYRKLHRCLISVLMKKMQWN